jgi:hypothetical protein
MDWARRRLGVLAAHLAPAAVEQQQQGGSGGAPPTSSSSSARASIDHPATTSALSRCPTSGDCDRCRATTTTATAPYATADPTGQPNAYARVHGAVPRDAPRWRQIPSVARERLEEVLYEKAEGEGIAKVRVEGSFVHL